MPYLLETSTCIDVMRNHPNVVKHMSAALPDDCAISTVTSYELHTGVAKCASPDKEQAKVDLLLKTVNELPFDQAAAREAGRIRGLLESSGEVIGPYDILLAAFVEDFSWVARSAPRRTLHQGNADSGAHDHR